MNLGSSVLHAASLVVGSTALVSFIGMVKNLLAASYFGTSGAMDAYLIALLLPNLVDKFSLTGIWNFVPLFSSESQTSKEAAWLAANRMVTYWLILLSSMVLLTLVSAPYLLPLMSPGFDSEKVEQTVRMCRILLLMTASCGTAQVLELPLVAQRRFFAATASQLAFQASSTAFLIAFHSWGIDALVWGMVVGGFTQLLVVVAGLGEFRRRLRFDVALFSPVVKKMIGLTLPTYIGTAGARLNQVIYRAFASLLPAGRVSALEYGALIVEVPMNLLANPLTFALYPFLSTQFAEDPRRALGNLVRALFGIAVAFTPIAVGTLLLADPLVQCALERGSFDANSTAMTAAALQMYAPSILALGMGELITAAYHARMNTATPMKIGLLRVALNTALCATLVSPLGHRGIALSATTSEFVKVTILVVLLLRGFPRSELSGLVRPFLRLVPAVGLMALVVYPLERYALPAADSWLELALGLVGVIAVGAVTYSGAVLLLCRNELAPYTAIALETLERLSERFPWLSRWRARP